MATPEHGSLHFATDTECRACPYARPCVQVGQDGKLHITPSTAFECVLHGTTLQGSISGLLDNLVFQVRAAANARFGSGSDGQLRGGINNARGEWLEYMLKFIFWNVCATFDGNPTIIVKLPNSAQLNFRDLYEIKAKSYLDQLFDSLQRQGMDMQMSNPDFVCVTNLPDAVKDLLEPMSITEQNADILNSLYTKLVGECDADSVPFVLTVKASLRPDRRYQIVHEANVVKSLVAHLAGRFWQRDLATAFYAMVASRVSPGDRNALRNPATHTLVQVSWLPVPVVDDVYQINTVEQIQEITTSLLDKHITTESNPIS